MITPGSVEGPPGGHTGFCTTAIFVIVPLMATTWTGIVISGKYADASGVAVLVHTIFVVPLQVHPEADIAPVRMTPLGRVSVTVVIHDT